MPLYFFDFNDDRTPSSLDTMGTDLPSLEWIPEEAVVEGFVRWNDWPTTALKHPSTALSLLRENAMPAQTAHL